MKPRASGGITFFAGGDGEIASPSAPVLFFVFLCFLLLLLGEEARVLPEGTGRVRWGFSSGRWGCLVVVAVAFCEGDFSRTSLAFRLDALVKREEFILLAFEGGSVSHAPGGEGRGVDGGWGRRGGAAFADGCFVATAAREGGEAEDSRVVVRFFLVLLLLLFLPLPGSSVSPSCFLDFWETLVVVVVMDDDDVLVVVVLVVVLGLLSLLEGGAAAADFFCFPLLFFLLRIAATSAFHRSFCSLSLKKRMKSLFLSAAALGFFSFSCCGGAGRCGFFPFGAAAAAVGTLIPVDVLRCEDTPLGLALRLDPGLGLVPAPAPAAGLR